jgi:hypothetical protein
MIAQTSIESINELLGQLKEPLLQAGVPEEQIRVRNTKHKVKVCSRAFDWLHDVKISPEMVTFRDVRGLLPEETWRRYKLLEIEGLREQELLAQASKALRARWRKKRPAMFNADIKRKKSDVERE